MSDMLVGSNYVNKRERTNGNRLCSRILHLPNPNPLPYSYRRTLGVFPNINTAACPCQNQSEGSNVSQWPMRGRKSAQLLVLCSSYSICCEMPILILNVTTGVTFKYKYHKLASLTSQSREYSWFLLQISQYSSIFPISISSQNTLFTNDSRKCNQYEMSFVSALSTSHPGCPHPCVISPSCPRSPHSGDVPQIWYQVLVVTIDIDGHTLCYKYSSSSLSPTKHKQPSHQL